MHCAPVHDLCVTPGIPLPVEVSSVDVAGGGLLAVLCNPALKEPSQTITWRNLAALGRHLGTTSVRIENLIQVPTRSTSLLGEFAGRVDPAELELRLQVAAQEVSGIVVAWGTGSPPGWTKADWQLLIRAATRGLCQGGHTRVAQVGGAPRHPSRWRQHTSVIHDRYAGDTFDERLGEALGWIDIKDVSCL